MNRHAGLPLAFLLAAKAGVAIAQPAPTPPAADYSNVEEKSVALGHGLFMVTGAGGNNTVAVGGKGVIVVDTQFSQVYDKFRATIATFSTKPILYVVNTHYHPDHTNANALFRSLDHATIVAYPQVSVRMQNPPARADGSIRAKVPEEGLPTLSYPGDSMVLDAGGLTAELSHPIPSAHTDDDTVVVFPSANVIATGDIVCTASYIVFDVPAGGNIDGLIAGANWVIAHSDRNTKIVPGHGPLTDRAGVIEYRDMMVKSRDIIAKARADGMTAKQVMSANLLKDMDGRWNAAGSSARFAEAVYTSLPPQQ